MSGHDEAIHIRTAPKIWDLIQMRLYKMSKSDCSQADKTIQISEALKKLDKIDCNFPDQDS